MSKLKYFLIVILFFLAIYTIVPSTNYTNCLASQRFEKLTFHGVVVNKFLDKSQHSTPIVEIRNFRGRRDSVYLFGDQSGLFNKIEVYDTLKKESGSNEVLTRFGSEYMQLGVADFKCDLIKFENEQIVSWLYEIFGTIPSDNTSKEIDDLK